MRLVLLLCSLSAILSSYQCYGANILAYILMPSYSHQVTSRPLWKELAKRHNITLLTTDLMEEYENITQIDLSGTYKLMEEYKLYEKISRGENIYTIIRESLDLFDKLLEYELAHPEVQTLLKTGTKFDLIITEFISTAGFVIGNKLNASMIGIISMDGNFHSHDAVGNPTHPVAYPNFDLPFSSNLSFKQRVYSVIYSIIWRLLYRTVLIPRQDRVVGKWINGTAPTEEILKNISMLFINANPLFNNVRPLGPKTVNIAGGFHLQAPKPLPKDLQDYLDNAPNGVIYFNLGSNVKSMHISNRTKDVILQTFAQLPYQILWKFEDDQLAERPANIKIMSWLPQQDILRHKNIKLFITQGGIQSMEEAIFNHVPMIGLPFFGDQLGNTNKMAAMGYGLELDHTHLDVKTFKATILEVINNSRYKQKAKELADLVLDQPMTGLEKAVWWTEYVLRHGNTDHFRDSIVDLPLYQYYLLDVIFFLLLVVLLGLYIVYKLFQLLKKLIVFLYSRIFSSKKIKTL